MAQFDSFSIAAAIVALLIAGGFLATSALQPRLASFRWWASAFLLLAIWLATSSLRPEQAGRWAGPLSWSCLYGAICLIVFGLHRDGVGRRSPAVAALACGMALAMIGSALVAIAAPPHLWMLLGALPIVAFLVWWVALMLKSGAWRSALLALFGIGVLAVRTLFHPAGAARLFGPPPPPPPPAAALRGTLSPGGAPSDPISLGQMPPPGPPLGRGLPEVLPPLEHQLAVTLITIGALVVLAGALVLHNLMRELHLMRRRSSTDAMTGLLNRATFEETARDMLAEPALQPLCMVLFDIDHFKRVNDTAGHAAGDKVIARLGRLLGEMTLLRTSAGRIGGEEFAVLLAGCTAETARLFAEAIRTGFATSPLGDEVGWVVTLSAGIAEQRPGESLDDVMRRADKALYAAKSAGRDRVMCAENLIEGGSSAAA